MMAVGLAMFLFGFVWFQAVDDYGPDWKVTVSILMAIVGGMLMIVSAFFIIWRYAP